MNVLAIHTPLLGNKVYSELLRRSLGRSSYLRYDAHWSTEEQAIHGQDRLEKQLERLFLKCFQHPAVRRRNLDLFTLRYELGTSYWSRRTLNHILRYATPDALHFHTQNVALLSLDVMRRISTVVSADNTSYLMANQTLAQSWRWTLAPSHAIERAAFHAAAAVVAFSDWAARSIVADHGVPAERVHVIPPGVEIEKFTSLAPKAPSDRVDTLKLLFVGGEFVRKGGPLLLELFAQRFASRGDVELHLVTRDAVVSPHPSIIVHRNVEAFSDAWFALYAEADIFVMPTSFDQSPIAYLEAMAARLPIVTTPIGAAPEIVLHGKTGFIVSRTDLRVMGDCIERLLDCRSLRVQFGEAARERVAARYSAAINSIRLEKLFLEIRRCRKSARTFT
ncbi:MAG: hypothetical protein NVSMB5_11940 [Candidatus Velthaea sp.]